ncbi:hypothetical protein [Lacisediminimonas sp.]|uniref:hypothetical protein n=1 Tax=Lacisediminimonas sp. TaxID=3060582 RepID=UPI0027182EE1|nr:hypothetical protein [Lacisediminimonas sp.]MDO8300368.1 hypothetical protein [Lacisediminimonas sp.]MDO9219209.1 hypothetical protein [Lacisediminimonas sp.]
MSPRTIARILPTSMGGILNAVCMVYFIQRGGNWIYLGVAHGVMVIVLAIIASQKARAKDAQEAASTSEPGKPQG